MADPDQPRIIHFGSFEVDKTNGRAAQKRQPHQAATATPASFFWPSSSDADLRLVSGKLLPPTPFHHAE
jgi:hypothetical protein